MKWNENKTIYPTFWQRYCYNSANEIKQNQNYKQHLRDDVI